MKKIMITALFALIASWSVSDELSIISLDVSGNLTFTSVSNATSYTVEQATTLSGPWTNSLVVEPSGNTNEICAIDMSYNHLYFRVSATVGLFNMAVIPSGTNSGVDPDHGAYSITIDEPFYMDSTEVTQDQWNEVRTWAITNGYSFVEGSANGPNFPITMVNWYDCVKWCNARSEKEGLFPCYTVSGSIFKSGETIPDCNFSANGYRLASNDEWEYAARGGLSGKRFPWGDTISHDLANYSGCTNCFSFDLSHGSHPDYPRTASPAGYFPPNGYGLCDMAGNVWERTADYESAPAVSTSRGGAYYNAANLLGCRYTTVHTNPLFEYEYYGFRAVRAATSE